MAGLDHAVIVSRDLGALSEEFEALGFTLTPTAHHPWGTANRLVQFAGRNFLELLGIDRPELIGREPATTAGGPFSFGRHVAAFLAKREGMAMLALQGAGAEADTARWRAAGLATYEPFHFRRQAVLPDGTAATVAFSRAYTTEPALPDLAFFTCHQHSPELFWKAPYQRHANGSLEMTGVSMVTTQARQIAPFLSGLTGGECRFRGDGIECDVGPHHLEVSEAYGGPDGQAGASGSFVGLTIRVEPDSPRRGSSDLAGGIAIRWI